MRAAELFLAAQCRAGRGLLGWSQERLAAEAHLELEAVALYERGERQLSTPELIVLGAAFNRAGMIAFGHEGEPGVRFIGTRTLFDGR
jgi:transcriptional regulator with XRE-family HTH domain